MISKNDILTLARNITQRKKRGTWERINPAREWVRGLAIAAVLLGASMGYAAISFMTQHQAVDAELEVVVNVPKYDEVKINHAIDAYRAREGAFNALYGPVVETREATTSTTTIEQSEVGLDVE